jgi:hypothetical protein
VTLYEVAEGLKAAVETRKNKAAGTMADRKSG